MKKQLLLSALCLAGLSSFAQVNQYQTTHELGADDYGNAIIYDPISNANIIVGSSTSNPSSSFDVLLTYADQTGTLLSAGGQVGGSGWENGRSLNLNSTGNLMIGGSSESFSATPANTSDFFSAFLDNTGSPAWVKAWGTDSVDIAQKIIEANDGNVLIAGNTRRRNSQRTDILVTKLNAADGDTLWSREVGHAFINEAVFDLVALGQGEGYLIIGYSGANVIGLNDALLTILDDNGNLAGSFVFGASGEDDARSFISGDLDKFYIAGNTRNIGAGAGDAFLAQFDVASFPPVLDWFKTYGSTGEESVQSAIGTSDGNILITGTTNSFGNGQEGFILKVNSNGELQWSNVYGGTGDDFLQDIAENSSGGFTAVGFSNSFGATTNDLWLVSIDALGNSGCSQSAATFVEETIAPSTAYMAPLTDIASEPVTLNERLVIPALEENTVVQNTVCLTTSISEAAATISELKVFPTPATDNLNIELPESGNFKITLYTLAGRAVTSTTHTGSKALLSTANLASGVYMLEVKSDTQTWKSKVVKN